MKIGISGDWHIDNMQKTYMINGKPNREIDLDNQIKTIAKESDKRKIDKFIIAGDLLLRNYINGYYLEKLLYYIRLFLSRGIEVIIIPGNHDCSESGFSITYGLASIRELKGLIIVEEISVIDNILFLPHERKEVFSGFDSYSDYVFNFYKKNKKHIKCIIGHFQPTKAIPGSEIDMFAGSTRFLNTNLFTEKIFCNHVHKPQQIDNVTIVGSPVRFSFSERGEDKRFIIYDTLEDSFESIPLKCQEYKAVNVDLLNKDSLVIEDEKLKKFKDCVISLRITTSKEKRNLVNSKDLIDKFEKYKGKVVDFKLIIESDIKEERKKFKDMSPEGVVSRFIEERKDKPERKKKMKELFISELDEIKKELKR